MAPGGAVTKITLTVKATSEISLVATCGDFENFKKHLADLALTNHRHLKILGKMNFISSFFAFSVKVKKKIFPNAGFPL